MYRFEAYTLCTAVGDAPAVALTQRQTRGVRMDTGTPSGQAVLFDRSSEPASPVPVTDRPEVRPARKGRSGSSKSSAVPSLENRAYATRLAIHTYWVGLLV